MKKLTIEGGIFASPDELRGALAERLALVDVVSFDVFDTLIERRVGPPEQVKQLAARYAAAAAAERGQSLRPATLLDMRHQVEAALRGQSLADGHDHECKFSDLARELSLRLAPGSATEIAAEMTTLIVESELAAERQVLLPKPGMIELLAELRRAGKRVIAISDMYLDGVLLARLLHDLGFDLPRQALYVSADVRLGKYSGRLFHHVFRQEQVAPSRLLHVGDNPASDFRMPRSLGAHALLLHQTEQVRRAQQHQAHKWLSERNSFWRGPHLALDLPPSTSTNFYTRYGHDVLGPVFSIFVARVRELLHEGGYERVFFLAREGDLFLKISRLFEGHGPVVGSAPPHCYLHVSRKAVALPAAHRGLTKERLQLLGVHMRLSGLEGISSALGIDPAALSGVASSLGLDSLRQPLDPGKRDWPALLAGSTEFQNIIRRNATAARVTLRQYLEQEGFFGAGSKVALVDIGWNGSIQRALRDAYGGDADWPEVHGFYLSFNDTLGHGLNHDEATGILYDRRTFHPRHDVAVHFEEIFENSARALHASTVGYRQAEGVQIEPVFRDESAPDRMAEIRFNAITESLRTGILDYAEHFVGQYALYGYSAADLIPYAVAVAHRGIFFPTSEEAEHLLRMVHAEDAGTNSVLDFSNYRLRGPSMLLRPRHLLQAIRGSHWKYGTGRSLGVPGFNHLLRLAHRVILARDQMRGRSPRPRLSRLPAARWWEAMLLAIVRRGGLPLLLRLRDKFGPRR